MQGPNILLIVSLSFSLYLTHVTSSSEYLNGDFKIQNDTYFSNTNDVSQASAKTLIQCAHACLKTSICQYAAFNHNTETCMVTRNSSHDAVGHALGWTLINTSAPISSVDCVRYGSSCYKFVDTPLSINDAKVNCENLGGKLVEVETEAENNFLKSTFYALDSQELGFWLGAYSDGSDYNFEWISRPNEPMSFTDFYPGEPDGHGQEPCLAYEKGKFYTWVDVICDDFVLSYVCEFSV